MILDIRRIKRDIELKKQRLSNLNKHPFRNRKKIKTARMQIQATEAVRDIMTTYATQAGSTQSVVNENNYPTYAKQVIAAYDMYENRTKYGGEIFRGITDTTVALIMGEGMSVKAERKETQNYIDRFIRLNKLQGSRLINFAKVGQLEGKNLIILKKSTSKDKDYSGNEKRFIKARSFSFRFNSYSVEADAFDFDDITKISYKEKENKEEKVIPVDSSIFVRLGGTAYNINETTNKLLCTLTDCENFSRAKYDLRNDAHLMAHPTPNWKLDYQDPGKQVEADAINNSISALEWEPGQGYAGTAAFSYITPDTGGAEILIKDMLNALRSISSLVGIPIHWLSWPELMSNRATAENMLEMVNLATKEERLIWEEKLHEVIEKSMVMAVDAGFESGSILGEFTVKLPLVSLATLKSLIEVWYPLVGEAISMSTFQGMLPAIDPSQEAKRLKKEKEEKIKDNPLFNNINGGINEQNNNETTGESARPQEPGEMD